MAISKKIREEVYRKYDGHCAYCGREIAYKDMQVDHFLPLRAWRIEDAGTDDISNLMPSCRMCNHYKRANTLETFRRYIAEIPRKLRENYIYKVGVVYGNVIENEKPIEFYFEKQKSATHFIHVKNHWDKARCSVCKRIFESYEWGSNYCPVCGAKMHGKDNNVPTTKEDDTPTIAETAAKRSKDAKRKLTRADILHAAEKCVCGQREQDYGTPEDNFETIAELWETYLRRACVDEAGGVYVDANDVAMMMALLKIARIAAGGGKADSWIDLAGYAACGAECEGVTE